MTPSKLPSDFFIFGSREFAEPGEPDDVFVFTSASEIDIESLVQALRSHMEESPPPGRLFLLGARTIAETIVAATESERLRDALPEFTRYRDPPPLFPLAFDEKGKIEQLGNAPVSNENLTETIIRDGLRWIFDKRRGMLRAGPGFHYLNPSGRHTTGFIRTGNVLLHSAEIAFVAMGILRRWPTDLRRIFVDTASISSVAYALIELRRMFEPGLRPPSIDSFSSYAGLKEFLFEKESLCLISASTSGSLHRKIVQGGHLPSDRVITLFYCGPPVDHEGVLCDLTERTDQEGIAAPDTFDRVEDCEMCQRGLDVIGISGDQFLPANPEVDELVLNAEHAPPWLNDFLRAILGQRIVRCHAGMAVDGTRPREIFFHLKDAVSQCVNDDEKVSPRFSTHLQRRLDAAVPASLSAIVHVDNASSTAMSMTVKEYFATHAGKRELPTFKAESLQGEASKLPKGASVLVAAGAISSGRTLLGISQFLRNVAEVRSIVYLIGVARSSSEAEWRRLQSNLTWGQRRLEYPLSTVTSAYLPAELSQASSPWAGEMQFLREVRDHISGQDDQADAATEEIEARRAQIDEAGSIDGEGLMSKVFLPKVRDGVVFSEKPHKMQLGQNFVFWREIPDDLKEKPTQAEVYLTLASILHHLRDGGRKSGTLVQHEHNRTILAPANFGRFNDGVIQAALLRAARPRELDYSHDKDASGQMRDTLMRIIERRENPEGEAAPEFLLALAQDRIHLMDSDREELVNFLDMEELPPLMWALAEWMKHKPGVEIESEHPRALSAPSLAGPAT
jgi:hypothetical protein